MFPESPLPPNYDEHHLKLHEESLHHVQVYSPSIGYWLSLRLSGLAGPLMSRFGKLTARVSPGVDEFHTLAPAK